MLLVHAHPDDETINNGVTMAKYAASGVDVTLVTCTRGEEGEKYSFYFPSVTCIVISIIVSLFFKFFK